MIRSFLSVLLFNLICINILMAQHHSIEPDRITISSSGEAIVPADIATFSINISATHMDADRAFELHREKESFLTDLLQELEFEDEQIDYQPITIRPDRQRDGNTHSTTSQRVQLELKDLEMISQLQRELISNGFDNFSGNLTSTELEEAGKTALQQAVKNARMDAEILAEAAGKTLGRVISIQHTSDSVYPPAARAESMQAFAMNDSGSSLSEFSQTVTVQKRVEIIYQMDDK